VFDFRYHALSLVAVFLALAIGILLGASIGAPPLSDADESVRRQLQRDVERLSEQRAEAAAELKSRDRLIEEAYPRLAGGRLSGAEVAIVASGRLPGEVDREVRDAVEVAGGGVASVTVLDLPAAAGSLASAAGGQYAGIESGDERLQPLLLAVGASVVRGGPLARRLQEELPDRFRGELNGADAVVFYRHPPEEDEADAGRDALEAALIEGLASEDVPIVGVEELSTEPSQIAFYRDHDLSSVDSVDLVGGRLALVLALGGEEGAFGSKDSADRALPDATGS
jgi:Copper transport outer membrane protein, MctB